MTMTSEQLKNTDTLTYILARNEETHKRAAAEGWSFYGTIPTDSDYVGRFANAYDYCLDMARASYSDAHKEAYSCRAAVCRSLTLEEVETMTESLYASIEEDMERERLEIEAYEAEQLEIHEDAERFHYEEIASSLGFSEYI